MRSRNGVGGGVGGDDDELLSVCPSVYRSNRSFLGPAGYIILQSQSQSSVRPAVPTPFPALLNTYAEILCGDFIATGKYRDSAEKDLDESQIQIRYCSKTLLKAGAVARTVIPASGRRVICGLVSEGASTWASNVRLNVRTERPGDVLEESSPVGALRPANE